MSNLSITIFNRFQILLDGNPITDQLRLKTQGLVAYLAVEVEKPHRREELAGLLWPDQPEDSARSNLRQSLVQLRHVLGGTFSDYFDISPLALMYTPIQGNDVDVTQFSALIQSCNQHHHTRPETCPECFERLNTAMELYQGELLKNFSIKNSTVFDEWIMINREKYHRQAMSALYNLAEYYAFHSNFTLMSQVAQRQIDLDPLQENAYRQLMRSLVLSGKRNEALLVYEDLRILLDREMHIQPELGTITLYQQIYSGKFKTSKLFHSPHSGPTTSPKPFLNDREPERNEIPLLVAREQELARMENLFNQAMSGRGQLVLISGDAGRGKTALLSEFSRLTLLREASVVIAGGNGNAQTGVGDPYLPFREILAQLSGDVEDRWTAGSINKEQASRLWNLIPATIQIVMDKGPDLINTFLNGKTLLKRALSFISITDVNEVTWPLQLEQLVEQKMQNSLSMTGAVAFQQIGLFDQFTQVLHTLVHMG